MKWRPRAPGAAASLGRPHREQRADRRREPGRVCPAGNVRPAARSGDELGPSRPRPRPRSPGVPEASASAVGERECLVAARDEQRVDAAQESGDLAARQWSECVHESPPARRRRGPGAGPPGHRRRDRGPRTPGGALDVRRRRQDQRDLLVRREPTEGSRPGRGAPARSGVAHSGGISTPSPDPGARWARGAATSCAATACEPGERRAVAPVGGAGTSHHAAAIAGAADRRRHVLGRRTDVRGWGKSEW